MSAQLFHGDCLEILPTLEAGSVDMVLADPPYGQTACAWDSVIDLPLMWQELKRVIKPNGAIALFGSQPFTSVLITSNLPMFKHCWVWRKSCGAGFLNAQNAPIKYHEDIAVFSHGTTANRSKRRMQYNPQGLKRVEAKQRNRRYDQLSDTVGTRPSRSATYTQQFKGYPTTILDFPNERQMLHPTQKPVALLRYFLNTYTNKGDTVLDFCMGSGSTGVACVLEGRSFIGIEKDTEHGYFEIAQKRIHEAQTAPRTLQMELTA